ncbi:hypothetical protein V5O48_010033 [Marasmius crinis-equi]|uniref:Uncharacterized protein n=1 Tax=Marasmius crinis-equi TaxID=585013 RepID=A0ABR3F9N4_9AGAR
MMGHSKKPHKSKEGSQPPSPRPHCPKQATEKHQLTEQDQEESKQQKEKRRAEKQAKARQKELRRKEKEPVQNKDDSEEVRKLKERAEAAGAQLKTANDELSTMQSASENSATPLADNNSIEQPKSLSKTKVKHIRQHLNLVGHDHNRKWNKICADEMAPKLKRFKNQWATEFLAKDYFKSHKTYKKCANNPNTYCGRHCSKSPTPPPVASTSAITLNGQENGPEALFEGDLPGLSSDEDEDGNGASDEEEDDEYQDKDKHSVGKGKGKATWGSKRNHRK